jgi:hypothetical protein
VFRSVRGRLDLIIGLLGGPRGLLLLTSPGRRLLLRF